MKESERPPRAEPIVDLEVPISVILAERSFSLQEFLELRPGGVLDFGQPHDSFLEMFVNGACVGRGRAVDVGEKLGFLLEEVESGAESEPRSPPSLPGDPASMQS